MIRYDRQNRKNAKLAEELAICRGERDRLDAELRRIREVLTSTMHEVRRFNGEIYATSESLHRLQAKDLCSRDQAELCETIYYTSGMLSARLGFADFELNPTLASRQATYRSGIYKKFEKSRYVLAQKSRTKRIQVIFKGNSYIELELLPAFELVPFILLDNALKYSPTNQDVVVSFEEDMVGRNLGVVVSSLGPVIEKHELESIFERGARGKNARCFDGEGLGLFLAKHLCDWHDIGLNADCDTAKRFDLDGVPYGDVEFRLKFAY